MKPKPLAWLTAFGLSCLLLSSCYTVVRAPRTAADVQEEQVWAEDQTTTPRVGRFRDQDDWGDSYRYPGAPYSGGGYPIYGIGYDSRYGMYSSGAYGYGAPYGYGYGGYGYDPYGYGYDPYYRDTSGYYLPPGYELISTDEREQMEETIRDLSDPESSGKAVDTPTLNRQREQQDAAWDNRTDDRRRESTLAPRPVSAPPKIQTSSGGSAKPATSTPTKKPKTKETERRRR